jgi:hypothetical protein
VGVTWNIILVVPLILPDIRLFIISIERLLPLATEDRYGAKLPEMSDRSWATLVLIFLIQDACLQ